MCRLVKYNNFKYSMPIMFSFDLYVMIFKILFQLEINPVNFISGSPICLWSENNSSSIKIDNIDLIKPYIQKIRQNKIVPQLDFSKNNITKEDLIDKYCNELLDVFYDNEAYFIVSSDNLFDYIKSKYSDAKIICPISKFVFEKQKNITLNMAEFCNEMMKKYDIIDCSFEDIAKNKDNINVSLLNPSKLEVVLNSKLRENLSEIDEMMKILSDLGINQVKICNDTNSFDELYDTFYKYLFTSELAPKLLKTKIDIISANILKENILSHIIYF